jgi:hypothetical protein
MIAGLRISSAIELPVDIVTDTIGILAIKGSGKTYSALVLLEQMVTAGIPVVMLDPVGVAWGLRSSADGAGAGLPVIVLGGDHGDAPIGATAGRAVADFVVAERQPTVIDFSAFHSKADQQRFAREFLERLYESNRDPLHLFIDEADDFAPQRPFGDEARLLRAIEVLVRRGRARGLGCTLITQRAAVLNKNVLTQVSTLILGRTVAPQDRKAIEAWVEVHGTEEQKAALLESLAALPTREKWAWSPDRGIFARVPISARKTFDSSATPKVGDVRIVPKALAEVDLDALRARFAETIEKGDEDDDDATGLRECIAELEAELAEARTAAATVERVEVPVLSEDVVQRLQEVAIAAREAADEIVHELRATAMIRETPAASPPARRDVTPENVVPSDAKPEKVTKRADPPGATRLGKCERSLLVAIVQRGKPTTRDQAAIRALYATKSRGVGNALGALRGAGLIEGPTEAMCATRAGEAAIGRLPASTNASERVAAWSAKLGKCERALLDALVGAYPRTLNRLELGEITDYEATSRGVGNALGHLRGLALVDGWAASRALMENP